MTPDEALALGREWRGVDERPAELIVALVDEVDRLRSSAMSDQPGLVTFGPGRNPTLAERDDHDGNTDPAGAPVR